MWYCSNYTFIFVLFFLLSVFPPDLVPASETLQSQIGASASG